MILVLTLTLLFALAACSGKTTPAEQTANPTAPAETITPTETATPAVGSMEPTQNEARDTKHVLDTIADYHPDTAGGMLQRYVAAATVLDFCEDGGVREASFAGDVKAYLDALSAEQREAFVQSYDDVAKLAEDITRGDVDEHDLESWRADAGVVLEHESYNAEQLAVFSDAIHTALG